MSPVTQRERTDVVLLIAFAAVLTVPLLSIGRSLDTNALTNWNWIFPHAALGPLFLYILFGIVASLVLSRTSLLDTAPGLVLPVLAFLAVVPLWGGPEVIIDASRYFLQAKHLELYGTASFFREWGGSINAWTDLPVVPFLFGLVFRYAGESRLFIQAFTTLLFSLTVLLTYHIGRRLWDKETGVAAGFLLLAIPYLLMQAPLMLVDVPAMFFLSLAVFTYLTAVEQGGLIRMGAAASALFLGLFSKYSLGIMLPPLLLIVSLQARCSRREALGRSASVLAGAAVLSLALFLPYRDVIGGQVNLLRTYQWEGLKRWHEGIVSTLFFQTHPFLTIAAGAGLVAAIARRDARFLVPAWAGIFAIFLHHERMRYLLPLAPLFTLMASRGLQEIPGREARLFIAWCSVTTSLVLALGAYAPVLEKMSFVNLRDAGGYLDTLDSGVVDVYALPQPRSAGNTEAAVPLLDLFTRKELRYRALAVAQPDQRSLDRSSLRFSWEVRLPAFYTGADSTACSPVAVLTGEPLTGPPSGIDLPGSNLSLMKRFESSTGVFKYKIFVTLFKRTCMAETAQ
jgi:4-amino-4-deoxy-L-arabinose transferase-like glycosyltransferase